MARTKQVTKAPETRKRIRRSEEQLIKDLQSKIEALRARAELRKVKQDPSLRYIAAAVRNIDKALVDLRDQATRRALDEARSTLTACLELKGGAVPRAGSKAARGARAGNSGVDADALLVYIMSNPGQRSEQICAALGTDAGTLRPVVRRLIEQGKVKTQGQRRGMTYSKA